MKILTKSKKKKTFVGVLLFQISLLSVYSQNFNSGDFTTPREITTINNTTSGGNTRNMIAYGDLNADGKNDIVKVGVNQIIVLENIYTSGDISNISTSLFNNLTAMATETGSTNVVVTDINGDTKPDIVVGCDSYASIFINSSVSNIISFNTRIDVSTYGSNIELFDVDGDGLLDLIHSPKSYFSKIGINLNDNTSGIFSSTIFDFSVTYGSMEDWTFADFDQNGTLDFFSARASSNSSNTGIYIAKNISTTGNINFESLNFKTIPGMTYASYGSPKSISCTDIDNDNKQDVLVQLGDKTHFFLNTNSTVGGLDIDNFTESNVTSQNSSSNFGLNFGIGDLDKDGKIDVISPGSNTSGTFLLKNNSTPATVSFSSSTNIQSITNQTSIIVDLDGDTNPEIVNARYYSDKIYVVKYTGAILGTDTFETNSFEVYPNPSNHQITVKTNTNSLTTANVYTVSGQLAFSNLKLQYPETSIDISSLRTGVYILELKNELGVATYKKLIKE